MVAGVYVNLPEPLAESVAGEGFNTCAWKEHPRTAAQFVDAAMGMRGQAHDTAARAFAAYLYSGRAFGNSVKRAFHQACAAIGSAR